MVHPIIDEYYSHNPYHSRSSKFVNEKGLVSNEKATPPRVDSPAPPFTSEFAPEELKKTLPPSKLHETLSRNVSPESYASNGHRSPDSDAARQTPENGHTTNDVRRLTLLSGRDPSLPQEQTNTKKKRRSVMEIEPVVEPDPAPTRLDRSSTSSSGERDSFYGTPAKIAKFFPELTLS